MNTIQDVRNQIIELFNHSQTTTAVHQKNSIYLYKLVNKSEKTTAMLKQVMYTILQADESVYVTKLIQYIGAFYVILKQKEAKNNIFASEGCPLSLEILNFLLKTSHLSNDNVRLNSLKMIHEILDILMDVEIEESICHDIDEHLLDRLWDPKVSVRLEALSTLSRLQDYDNPEDPIIAEFIFLTTDSSSKVRQRAIELVAARQDVIQYFARSTRDKDPAE
ncbi:unnamed protein product [Callosobruchus maculatus]|uniref:Condensin complex subunit 1 C-terminal domain-containing protein n=1 Tax=Callosobruchus maculatus TaxID=64391 RepID=A0A653D8G4_CALMS|nr:unnamed protein product [Callosobruchus maculatus]